MTDSDIKKLSRNDLLELLIEQAKEIEMLQNELDIANRKLSERKIAIDNSGSIAEAALQLSGVFSAAQAACNQYIENVTEQYRRQEAVCIKMEQETQQKCARMIREAQRTADDYWNTTRMKVRGLYEHSGDGSDKTETNHTHK